MSKPYLILHKVRGEPAFDVAEKITIDGEIAWIVSTSGHRAFPFAGWLIEDLADISNINYQGYHNRPFNRISEVKLDEKPDHYACNDKPMSEDKYQVQREAVSLLTALGLVRKAEVDRRD